MTNAPVVGSPTIDIPDFNGNPFTLNTAPGRGRVMGVEGGSVALSTEDFAALTGILTALLPLSGPLVVTGPLTATQLAGAGLATGGKQDTANVSLAAIQALLAGAIAVSGPLTGEQLGAAGLASASGQGVIGGKLDALHADGQPISGYSAALSAGTAATPGRGIYINATAAGYVVLTAADASTRRAYCAAGSNFFPDAVTTFALPGTGAATVDSAYMAK